MAVFLPVLLAVLCAISAGIAPTSASVGDSSGTSDFDGAQGVQIPIFGTFLESFMFWANVSVGTPPVPFTVVIDTGSSDFLIPSAVCESCEGPNYYVVNASRTGSTVNCASPGDINCTLGCVLGDSCAFQEGYTGFAEDAIAQQDSLVIPAGHIPVGQLSLNVSNAYFGAIYNLSFASELSVEGQQQRHHRPRRDRIAAATASSLVDGMPAMPEGMWGLAYRSISAMNSTVMDQINSTADGRGVADIFSLSLQSEGGSMVLGNFHHNRSQYEWTDVVAKDFFRFSLIGVEVDGESIGVTPQEFNADNCIVDTGTPLATLSRKAYVALYQTMMSRCNETHMVGMCNTTFKHSLFNGRCFDISAQNMTQFPTITFLMPGAASISPASDVQIAYAPENYLIPTWNCKKEGHVGLGVSMEAGWNIIGASMMVNNYEVAFDRGGAQVGFLSVNV